ncbi:MAG: 30S ribosomal protein S2 [Candidatus Cloacimonetes bacterium]|nr:30S ribosomal protein S2 [Candidatus Cloacimonadota bacterium]
MSVVLMKQLLESGVHFGHQTHKWNPKMKKYIFIKRNGIHIIDLKQTVDAINESYMFIKEIAAKGKHILFVGTKKQSKDAIEAAAQKCGAFYVSNRWYGGMLTNMATIRRSISKLDYYEQIVEDGTINSFTKLEATRMKRKYDKIVTALGGIRGMDTIPGAVIVIDTIHEEIAVHEARKLGIPIVGMVDTNSDPDLIDYVIPANDDAIRAIYLITDIIANAVIEGRQIMMEGSAELTKEEAGEQETDAESEKPVKDDIVDEELLSEIEREFEEEDVVALKGEDEIEVKKEVMTEHQSDSKKGKVTIEETIESDEPAKKPRKTKATPAKKKTESSETAEKTATE